MKTTNLKQELLCDIQRHLSSLQCICDSYVAEYIATLKEKIHFLKNEVMFLRKDLIEKKDLIKSVFQNYFNSTLNLKDLQIKVTMAITAPIT